MAKLAFLICFVSTLTFGDTFTVVALADESVTLRDKNGQTQQRKFCGLDNCLHNATRHHATLLSAFERDAEVDVTFSTLFPYSIKTVTLTK